MMCRSHPFKVEQNKYGYAVATLNIPDDGKGWKASFAKCWVCGCEFVAVRPERHKTFTCIECLTDVRVH